MATYRNLLPGDPAPYFVQRAYSNPQFTFDVVAGRYIVLCFFAASGEAHSQAALKAVRDRQDLFNDTFASFFGVSLDERDGQNDRVADRYPGYRFFFDFDLTISKLYGVVDKDANERPSGRDTRRLWMVIDPTMRVMKVIEFKNDQSDCAELINYLDTLPKPEEFTGMQMQAPIIVLPNVFEPELCKELITLYETEGSIETGFMKEQDGKTVGVLDASHKRRKDHYMEDENLKKRVQERFMRRVVPEIAKVHQYHVTRMERYIVACYAAEDGGHFRPHRDNTTRGTAHRRFAVSVNLNDDFDGGEVRFPEYGPRSYKAPAGGAVVFSCSLLHMVTKVTRGQRYAFLPFLYDDAAAAIRQQNEQYLGGGGLGSSYDDEEETSKEAETAQA